MMEPQAASELIQKFLRTMEARDLTRASTMMAPNAAIVFPGGKQFANQGEVVAAAKGRYQWVKKTFDHIDSFVRDGENVVYISGTLYGVNQHGVEFEGVRYIDRFTLCDGLITSQQVWNDLAESGVLEKEAVR